MRGGLVLDLNGMRGPVSLDEATLRATVLPGTRCEELDRALSRRGVHAPILPDERTGGDGRRLDQHGRSRHRQPEARRGGRPGDAAGGSAGGWGDP